MHKSTIPKAQCIANKVAICWLDRLAEHRDLEEQVHVKVGHRSQASSRRVDGACPQAQVLQSRH